MSEKNKKSTTKKTNKKVEEVKKHDVKKVEVKAKEEKKAETKTETKVAKKEEKKETKKATPAKEAKVEKAEKVEKTEKVEKKEEKPVVTEKKATKVKTESNPEVIIITICAVIIALVIGLMAFYFSKDSRKEFATYEGGTLTKPAFETYYRFYEYQYSASLGDQVADQIKEPAAQQAAYYQYLRLLAKKANVSLTSEDKAEIEKQVNSEDLSTVYEQSSLTKDDVRRILTDGKFAQKYFESLKAKVTDEEVQKYIKDNQLEGQDMNKYVTRHILFQTMDSSTYQSYDDAKKAEIKLKATAVLKKALAGDDFAKLAKDNSEDTGTASEGGLFEFVTGDSTDEAYANAAKALKEGEITSTLVESSFGYHIIKLDKIVKNGRYDTIKEAIVESGSEKIAEDAKIKVNTDSLKEYVAPTK